MRYYRIEVANPDGSAFATFTSQVNGSPDPGALLVELDIPVTTFAAPSGGDLVRIWGVSLAQISQASDFNGKLIKVYGGMQRGLPLANPAQAGLLTSGVIQALGNWIGTNQYVEFYIFPDGGSATVPKNIVLNWTQGTQLSAALRATLETAFPSLTVSINISDKLAAPVTQLGAYYSMELLATDVKRLSQNLIGGDYTGVDMLIRENAIIVYDGPTIADPLQISFTDLIGQPTWIQLGIMQFSTVMRADIQVGNVVGLPQTQGTTTTGAIFQPKNQSSFQGRFQIDAIRHVGNSRAPDATSWISTFNAHRPLAT